MPSVARSVPPSRRSLLTVRGLRGLRDLMPTGGGLLDEDWRGRHRLLTWTMIGSAVLITAVGAAAHRLDEEWLVSIVVIMLCTLGAVLLPPRRLPSAAVALGLTAVCAELVMMSDGLTEAHFSFFVAVGALALYRDWVPFGVFLVATVAHHLAMGALMPDRTYDHVGASHSPLFWALVHGIAVLLAAGPAVADRPAAGRHGRVPARRVHLSARERLDPARRRTRQRTA